MEIRGSSHLWTGKFTNPYGEVHILRTGKFISFRRFPQPNLHKRTGKFTPNGFKRSWVTVRGSSRANTESWCTGKFTSWEIGKAMYGDVHH